MMMMMMMMMPPPPLQADAYPELHISPSRTPNHTTPQGEGRHPQADSNP